MDRIKPLTKDMTDSFVGVGDRRSYLVPFAQRKPVTNDTDEITAGRLAAKVEEIISNLNLIIDKINELENKND